MEDIHITYTEEPKAEFPAMMAGVEKVTKRGIYVNNVHRLVMNRVSIQGQDGAAWNVYHVDEFLKDGVLTENTAEPAGDWIES